MLDACSVSSSKDLQKDIPSAYTSLTTLGFCLCTTVFFSEDLYAGSFAFCRKSKLFSWCQLKAITIWKCRPVGTYTRWCIWNPRYNMLSLSYRTALIKNSWCN